MLKAIDLRSTAICYASDPGFLFPSVCSIQSLLTALGPEKAHETRIFYFMLDFSDADRAAAEAALAPLGVRLITMDAASVRNFDVSQFAQTHVTLAALARLFIEEWLPADIERLLYLDGDTLFKDEPSALLALDLPEGGVGAAFDQSYYYQFEAGPTGARIRQYFGDLGLRTGSPYFNSGVMIAERATWRAVARDAFAFFRENTAACRYHDQSCMNAVLGARGVVLSPRWNFQSPFRQWAVEDRVKPVIYHFIGGPKPWTGVVRPWRSVAHIFEDMARRQPVLRAYRTLIDHRRRRKADARERTSYLKLRTVFAPRLLARRRLIGEAVSQAII